MITSIQKTQCKYTTKDEMSKDQENLSMILGRRLFSLVHFTPHTQQAVKTFFYIWKSSKVTVRVYNGKFWKTLNYSCANNYCHYQKFYLCANSEKKPHSIKSQKVTPY